MKAQVILTITLLASSGASSGTNMANQSYIFLNGNKILVSDTGKEIKQIAGHVKNGAKQIIIDENVSHDYREGGYIFKLKVVSNKSNKVLPITIKYK